MPGTVDICALFVAVAEPSLPPSASIVETQEGFDVIDKALSFNRGDTLLIWFCGRQQHAYWAGSALIRMMAKPSKEMRWMTFAWLV
ncbi:hypothetical protein [Enterobacter kobei]|uniref:hypothetical protein n=1 Tax=Enterobacter kobei TaxID=208224 RepID=UPI0006679047|nr:hypothetical protein [Enterobacter kobei]WBN88927.1 hypothetical protein KJE18_09340 [Enterobacter kobei]